MRCIVLKQSSAWVIPSSRSFEEEGLSPREKYFNFSKKHRKRGMRYMLQCLPTWCTDKPAPLTWCRTEYARCTIETRDPVDGQTSIYRCGLASLNDLRIWNVQSKCLLRLFPLGCQEYVILYMYYNQRKFALELTQFFKSRELTAEDHTMKNYILKKVLLCFIGISFPLVSCRKLISTSSLGFVSSWFLDTREQKFAFTL